jgi:hypothetical protein
VKGIQVCSIKEPGPLQRVYNHKNVKMGWGHLKNYEARKAEFYMKALFTSTKARCLKSWPPGVGWGKWK